MQVERLENTTAHKVRTWALAIGAVVSSAVAIAKSENAVLAALLVILIVLGFGFANWVLHYTKRTEAERDDCHQKLGAVYDKLHKRDVALAILHTEASQLTTARRRNTLTRLEDLLGEDGRKATEEAEKFLSRTRVAHQKSATA